VRISEELCIYCAACVLNCIVDDCIRVTGKREDGRIEVFSTPEEALRILMKRSSERRLDLARQVSPGLKRRMRIPFSE